MNEIAKGAVGMTDHITRVREQARERGERMHIPLDRPTHVTELCAVQGFVNGAEWLASRLAREKIADAITNRPTGQSAADAILALMVEGE